MELMALQYTRGHIWILDPKPLIHIYICIFPTVFYILRTTPQKIADRKKHMYLWYAYTYIDIYTSVHNAISPEIGFCLWLGMTCNAKVESHHFPWNDLGPLLQGTAFLDVMGRKEKKMETTIIGLDRL